MKRLFSLMIIFGTLITLTFSSCSKDDSLGDHNPPPPPPPPSKTITLNLTTDHWEAEGNGVFLSAFRHVIPYTTNYTAKVYLVRDGKDIPIDQAISFMNGELWATKTSTDVNIHYRGGTQDVEYLNHVAFLNIKVVID